MTAHTHDLSACEQFELFAGLPAPEVQPRPRQVRACALRRVAVKIAQLTLDLRARAEIAEEWVDRWVSRPIVKSVVPASKTRMPETRAVASIFDLGYQVTAQQVIAEFMMGGQAAPEAEEEQARFQEQPHTRIIREAGVIRCQRLHHTDTQEWQEREAARRARQRPPKPTKKAKTMSAKLAELAGG